MKLQKQILIWIVVFLFMLFSNISLLTHGMDRFDRTNNKCGCILSYINMERVFNEDNKKLFSIKKFFLDVRGHNTKKIERILSDDVTFIITGRPGMVPLAGTYNGKENVKRYVKEFCSSIYNAQMIFQYNLINQEYINTHVQLIAKVKSSGKTMNLEFVYNWKLNEDGKIKFLRLYYDTYSWYTAFQPGGSNYVEDFKGDMDFNIHAVNLDSQQFVKDMYTAYNTGNIPALLEKLDENFVFILKGDPNCVYPGKYYQGQGFLQFANNLYGVAFYTQPLTCKTIISNGSHIDYIAYEELIWRSTGKAFTSELVHSLIISDDGKLIEFKSYNDSFDVYLAAKP